MSRLLLQRAQQQGFRFGFGRSKCRSGSCSGRPPPLSFFHTSTQHLAPPPAGAAAAQKTTKPPPPPPPPDSNKKAAETKAPASTSTPAAAETAVKPKEPSEKVLRLVNELADLSVVDFADLTEHLKKRLGLDNANLTVPMMMPAGMVMPGMAMGLGAPGAAGAAGAAPAAAEEKPVEKQVFDIKLEKYEAADKIKVIKEVRAFTALGLKEAKDLVEKLPAIVKKSVTKDEANDILNKLKAAGGVAVME